MTGARGGEFIREQRSFEQTEEIIFRDNAEDVVFRIEHILEYAGYPVPLREHLYRRRSPARVALLLQGGKQRYDRTHRFLPLHQLRQQALRLFGDPVFIAIFDKEAHQAVFVEFLDDHLDAAGRQFEPARQINDMALPNLKRRNIHLRLMRRIPQLLNRFLSLQHPPIKH